MNQAISALQPIKEGKVWDKDQYPSFISQEQHQQALKKAWEEYDLHQKQTQPTTRARAQSQKQTSLLSHPPPT